jgi:hypothetical protein
MFRARFVVVLSLSILLLSGCGKEKMDLLIVGGSVIDGTGTPATDTAVGLRGASPGTMLRRSTPSPE